MPLFRGTLTPEMFTGKDANPLFNVSGYGRSEPDDGDNETTGVLRSGTVTFEAMTDRELILGPGPTGQSGCVGDSGGPIMRNMQIHNFPSKPYVLATVRGGRDRNGDETVVCGEDNMVGPRISSLADWIESTVTWEKIKTWRGVRGWECSAVEKTFLTQAECQAEVGALVSQPAPPHGSVCTQLNAVGVSAESCQENTRYDDGETFYTSVVRSCVCRDL